MLRPFLAYMFCKFKLWTAKEEIKERQMNKVERIEREFLRAIKCDLNNADLYNDYAIFLYRYKNDYNKSVALLKKAVSLNPYNRIYRDNYNKILRSTEVKFNNYHSFFVLLIAGIMVWLSFSGYHNFMNMFSLFIVAQIVMNYQKNLCKKYN